MFDTSPRRILERYGAGELSRQDAMLSLNLETPHQFYALLKRLRLPLYFIPDGETQAMAEATAAFLNTPDT